MNWLSIETAPKDGTWVILTGGEITYSWEVDEKPACVVGRWWSTDEDGQPRRVPCWQFAWYDGGAFGQYENPTHWAPLPIPPNAGLAA